MQWVAFRLRSDWFLTRSATPGQTFEALTLGGGTELGLPRAAGRLPDDMQLRKCICHCTCVLHIYLGDGHIPAVSDPGQTNVEMGACKMVRVNPYGQRTPLHRAERQAVRKPRVAH